MKLTHSPELQKTLDRIMAATRAQAEARRDAELWEAETRSAGTGTTKKIAHARAAAAREKVQALAEELTALEAEAVALIEAQLTPTEADLDRARKAFEAAKSKAQPAVLAALKALRAAGARLETDGRVTLPAWVKPEAAPAFDGPAPKGSVAEAEAALRRIESERNSHDPYRTLDELLADAARKAA